MHLLRWPPPTQSGACRHACTARGSPDSASRQKARRKAQPAAISAFVNSPPPPLQPSSYTALMLQTRPLLQDRT